MLFLALLAFVTLVPFLLVPMVAHVVPEDSQTLYVYNVFIFVSANFHVASTGWFFTHREMLHHFRTRPLRYVIIPGILVLANSAAFQILGSPTRDYIALIFVAWLLWHYQKQNVGLLSFVAGGTDGNALVGVGTTYAGAGSRGRYRGHLQRHQDCTGQSG